MSMKVLVILVCLLSAGRAVADEGMWTFDAFPSDEIERRYGFRPDARWLEHVRLSSVRLPLGCSGSFVSPAGLVLTNHHCAHQCLEHVSTSRADRVRDGFLARARRAEPRCPDLEVEQLVAITDVTEQVRGETAGLEGPRHLEVLRALAARLERECQASSPRRRCELVSLYHGALHHLYAYRLFSDVRLVFAPELAIAAFGGDPDNFMFPRYDLDVAFLRAYEDGAPARLDHWLRWSASGPREGELTFVSGHPGATDRQLTVAELEYQRDVALPEELLELAERRGLLTEFQRRGPEQRRFSGPALSLLENSYKELRGEVEALRAPKFFAARVAAEQALRARLAADPESARRTLPAFDAIARAVEERRKLHRKLHYVEWGGAFSGRLFEMARTLVRGAVERQKPDGQRYPEFHDSAIPAVTERLFSRAPIHDELEAVLLEHSLSKLRENLGVDDPFVRKVLGKRSPEELAGALVRRTRLKDVRLRKALWVGGEAAVNASRDPMIELARRIDADGRALRQRYEEQVEAVLRQSGEIVARARFALGGAASYPDATFTLRLSHGRVEGFEEDGRPVRPFTRLGGAFERATGRDPFALPASWLRARPRLDLSTPFNFCTSNDIVGGNSGSPVIDREARVVGLAFDGNIHSLGGTYGFEEKLNRTVALDSAAILEALEKIYRADRLLQELRAERGD
jgi:Peptidase S46